MQASLSTPTSQAPSPSRNKQQSDGVEKTWVTNASLFWDNRRIFLRTAGATFAISILVAFSLPKQYESGARIMPPEQGGNGAAMLAALVGKSSASSLSGLAGSLIGVKNNSALFVALLHSGTVSGHLIDKFDLQRVYHRRYRDSTAKRLAHLTKITEDSKSGVITIVVTDGDRERARDLANAYLDELNRLVARVNTSAARREREFIEQRLNTVQTELERAQLELSDFSRKNTTIDLKEQTRATVDAGSKLEGQLIAGETELSSLRQIYGDQNVRVRAAEARNAILQHELQRANGRSIQGVEEDNLDSTHPYPALRELPRLGVQWANLYRTVRIHETVFDLLSEEYETARIDEAKSIPTVGIIDFPGLPERKSSPHRFLIVLSSTALSIAMTAIYLLVTRFWLELEECDPRRVLVARIRMTMHNGWA
ncbi:GumC family protein [Tunturiibacter gelidoferens]|uniref:Capsule polysaccharide export protein KpsE/RkpR n=1 Tax=Tunturiibacter gelidiferens TaxID=3069689 RepID=A0ACC5NW32_9BACT|nr:lipopolysaccharide biosynthesis protein [Edaphobacter lichenicola]MBB5338660.1 capsule polysaccharide export protein KpsE/RkpR [Edaphobacter lichenicola]